MEVILMEKVANLGQLGDIVNVKPGFARNFLIPKGIAKRANQANRAKFEAERAAHEAAHHSALEQAQTRATTLAGLLLQITQKAGVDGRLFGSVTNHDVVDALKVLGFEVHKSEIRMPEGPIKLVGDHTIAVALHSDVVVNITVSVLGEH